ncbi:MAG: portal protein [Alphaproteobacteria bacterium]|nr:portal protein [Alphaproteobacteria bacterium]
MAFELFGFSFGRKKESNKVESFVPKAMDDGSSIVEGGGFQGQYIDLDGTLKGDVELVRKYREMSLHAELDAAIDDICNDAITEDATGKIVELDLDKVNVPDEIKDIMFEEFQTILQLLNFNKKGIEIFRKWYVDGRIYYHHILHEDPTMGLKEVRLIDPLLIKKIREVKKDSSLSNIPLIKDVREYYVFSNYEKLNPYDTKGLKISVDSINYVHSGLYDYSSKRIVGYLHKAIKPLNQLRMVEDATVIYRWARAPERRVFYIDVGSLPKNKAEQYMRDQMNRFRNKLVYDANTGEIRDDRKHMSMLEDYWLPRREGGKGTEISTLPGGQNLGEMEDVLYFQKKLLKALNIPISRIESENGFNMGRASEITRDELKFSKFINRLRMKFSELFLNFLRTQVLAKQIMSDDDWKNIYQDISFKYATDSYFAESKQAEILRDRIAILRDAADYSGKFYSDRWLRKNLLRQTDRDIAQIDGEINEEQMIQMQKQQEAAMAAGLSPQGQGMGQPAMGGGGAAPQGDINTVAPQADPTGGKPFDASSLL